MDARSRREGARWTARLSGLALAVACAGCALPVPFTERELIAGYTEERTDVALTRRVVPGLDLSLEGGGEGLRLGWSDVTLARDAEPGRDAPVGYVAPLGWRWARDDRTHRTLGWFARRTSRDTPGALLDHRRQLGLGVEWGRTSRGVGLGWTHSCTLAVPSGSSGVWIASVESSDPAGLRFELVQ